MIVGALMEIKSAERRVGLTPASVRELVAHGHEVIVETGAGLGSQHLTMTTLTPALRSHLPPMRCGRLPR